MGKKRRELEVLNLRAGREPEKGKCHWESDIWGKACGGGGKITKFWASGPGRGL